MKGNKKKKKGTWKQYIFFGITILIGGVCGWVMALYMDTFTNGNFSVSHEVFILVAIFLLMIVVIYLQTVIHEAGHLIFGLCTGYRFLSFRIGSFMWIKQEGKLRFRRLNVAGTGGQCLMAPPDIVDGKVPVFLYNLGGSLMNLISAILCLPLSFLCGLTSVAGMFFILMVLFGLVCALLNGVPMNTGVVVNDGYNAISLGRNSEALRAFWIQMKIAEQMSVGVRLKDMPEEWFYMPSEKTMKNSLVASIGVFTCNRLLDALCFEEADKFMEELLSEDSGILGLHRNLLICDRIFCELIEENRQEQLEQMMDKKQIKFMKSMKNYPSVLRTQYAYALLCENDTKKAEKIKKQFGLCANTYPYPSEIMGERELMQIAENTSETKREI